MNKKDENLTIGSLGSKIEQAFLEEEKIIEIDETKEEFTAKAKEAYANGTMKEFMASYGKGGASKIGKDFFYDIDFWEMNGLWANPNNPNQLSIKPFNSEQKRKHEVYMYMRRNNLSLVGVIEEIVKKQSSLTAAQRTVATKMLRKKFNQSRVEQEKSKTN